MKRTRGRTGCLNCRARRKKCDEAKPTCSRCQACGDACEWDEAFPFRSFGISAEHPSMQQPQRRKTRLELQIVDMGFQNGKKRRKIHSGSGAIDQQAARDKSPLTRDRNKGDLEDESENEYSAPLTPASASKQVQMSSRTSSTLNEQHPNIEGSWSTTQSTRLPTIASTTTTASITQNVLAPSSAEFVPPHTTTQQIVSVDLGTLDYLTSYNSNIDQLASAVQMGDISGWSQSPETEFGLLRTGDHQIAGSPDTYSTYYPNAQYRELHTTLHQHMVETARNTALQRQSSPEMTEGALGQMVTSPNIGRRKSTVLPQGAYLNRELVTPRRQLELWRNYLDEIAPWLDMLDNECHFQSTVPLMAKSAPHLRYSILALSSRQIERRSSERSHTESLGLYQHAIQMIVHRLQDLETEVIASCVLLGVLEMMSSSPRAWARHLDGCAMLLEAAGINGAVGGVRQGIFWCFARMDLWAGYLGDTITKIPTNRWFIPSGSMAVAVSRFKDAANGADTYANYAVFLCASVVNVTSTQDIDQTHRPDKRLAETPELYSTRWKALYDLLEDWYNDRPEELLPLMNEQSAVNDHQNPFPILLYATSPGVSGNQMYHTAALLMLQHKPKAVRLPKSRKSIIWHARQICGIAASNSNHSAWTNALQPLWMAGKVMSHPSEHRAILDVLSRIEKETGFATEWRANDLKDYWGDVSDG